MGKKENRPDACTASGTASTICDYDSTFIFAGQDMTENELIRTVTEEYLAGIDVDIRPAPEDVERELLQATNNAIEAYNQGPRDPNAPVGAKQQDAYRHWFQRNVPSGRPVGRNAFLKSLKGLAAECGWLAQDKVRSDGRMDRPEPLILEYDVREWMNSGYTGSDSGRKCMPDLAESYRGFVRVSTAGSDEGNETDSEDKED